MSEKVDQRVQSWYGHVLRKRVWKASVSGVNLRGRPRKGWMEGVERALSMRGLSVEQGRRSASNRREWKAVVSG